MHEFSIVQSIVEIALDSARAHNVVRISAVEVEVGMASGVMREAMEFAWEAAKKGTILEDALLNIKLIPIKAVCRKCRTIYQSGEFFDPCPECGDFNPEIIEGKELRVVAIET
jgi:hydrogenase nickel incorporation protein HypA/HybF